MSLPLICCSVCSRLPLYEVSRTDRNWIAGNSHAIPGAAKCSLPWARGPNGGGGWNEQVGKTNSWLHKAALEVSVRHWLSARKTQGSWWAYPERLCSSMLTAKWYPKQAGKYVCWPYSRFGYMNDQLLVTKFQLRCHAMHATVLVKGRLFTAAPHEYNCMREDVMQAKVANYALAQHIICIPSRICNQLLLFHLLPSAQDLHNFWLNSVTVTLKH